LEHDDRLAAEPFRSEQRERYQRRLAGTRRCLYDERAVRGEGTADGVETRFDRKGHRAGSRRALGARADALADVLTRAYATLPTLLRALERVVLLDASADQLLQQRVARVGRCRIRDGRKRIPNVLQNDQQPLGLDAFVPC